MSRQFIIYWPLSIGLFALAGVAPQAHAQLQWILVDYTTHVAPMSGQAAATAGPPRSSPSSSQTTNRSAPTPKRSVDSSPPPSPTPFFPKRSVASTVPARSLAQASQPQKTPSPSSLQLRESLLIPPIVKFEKPWPSPSLNPGVPSAFVANWGDVFAGVSGATAGKQRPDVDGSFNLGFGLGSSAKSIGVELSGGCGSFKQFCGNGSFTARVGRLLINQSRSRLSLAAAWQNFAQWGYEGRQDNIYYGALSYAIPLRPPGSGFGQTLQFNAGVGNSSYAPFTEVNSEEAIGGFGSVGIELSPALGVSAGWSGRGANAQLSYTPFRQAPITLNLLGADLFNQTPAGTVAVFNISWGRNFTTPNFN